MIKFVAFVARAEQDVQSERVLRKSDNAPMAASPPLIPKEQFPPVLHLRDSG
jgi:hypothetical protein